MHRWKGRTWTGICLNCCSSCSSASFLLHSQSTTVFYYKWWQKILRFLGGFGLWHRTLNILQVIYWLRRENVKWKELICILQNMSNIKERQNTWEKNHLFLSYFKVLSELHCPQIPFYAFTGKKKKQENLHSNALGIIINPTAEKLTKNGSHLKEMWI